MSARDLYYPVTKTLFAPVEITISEGDCLDVLKQSPSEVYDCCITSPPYYFVRDYGHPDQIGLETSPVEFVAKLTAVFSEVRRVLKPEGTLWLNIGDNYCTRRAVRMDGKRSVAKGAALPSWAESAAFGRTITGAQFRHLGIKEKDLFLVPHDLAAALRADGWYLRATFHWIKPCVVPERERDAPSDSVEYIFLLSKTPTGYVYNRDALRECGVAGEGRPHRNVWEIAPSTVKSEHTATMPEEIVTRCLLTGTNRGGIILDPFCGIGTTGLVASEFERNCHLIDVNGDFAMLARQRIQNRNPFARVTLDTDVARCNHASAFEEEPERCL